MGTTHRPRISKNSDTCVVIDDFLPSTVFADLFRLCNSSDFKMVHAAKVQKVWRLHDGYPLHGETYRYHPGASSIDRTGVDRAAHSYPTGTALDRFVEAMLESLDSVGDIVGRPITDWREMTIAPWVYPAGAALSLHQDTGRTASGRSYTGSYTFYVHPEWNLHWGGWLLVFDGLSGDTGSPAASSTTPRVIPPWLGDSIENELVRGSSIATAILPTPNRIVFISPQAPHMITRVDPNAGHHPRVSLAGFFLGASRRD